MNPSERYEETAAQLIGRTVRSVWMVLYTLKMEVAATDDDARRLQIWLEPSWHLRDQTRLIIGSGAIESPDDFGDEAEVRRTSETIHRVSDLAQVLVGQIIERVELDPITFELRVTFRSGVIANTFADDPKGTLIWVLSASPREFAIRGTAQGIVTGIRAGVV